MKVRISEFDVDSHDILEWPPEAFILLVLARVMFIATVWDRCYYSHCKEERHQIFKS